MKQDFNRQVKYTWKVLVRGTRDAVNYYLSDWRNSIANLVVGVISGVVSPFVLYRLGGLESLPNIALVGEVGVSAGIIAIIATYLLVWLVNIIYAPGRLHHDLEMELEKTTWKGVTISEYEFPPHSGFGVGINVHNGKLIPIRDLKVGIYEIRKGRTIISQETCDLPWYMNLGGMWQRIITTRPVFNAGEEGKVLIANWDEHGAYFETYSSHNERKMYIDAGEKYYGKIVIVGRLQEMYTSYPVQACELTYDGEKIHLKLYDERLVYDVYESPRLFNQ